MTDSSKRESAVSVRSVPPSATHRYAPSHLVTAPETWALVLVTNRVARARVEEGMRGSFRCQFVATVAQAEAALKDAPVLPVVAILEAVDGAGVSVGALCRSMVSHTSPVAVIGYCKTGEELSREILAFAKAGAHELIFDGVPDGGRAIRRSVERSKVAVAADRMTQLLLPELPLAAHEVVEFALRHPEITTVTTLARALAIHRKTLFMQCQRAHLPPPGILLGWCRLSLATHLLAQSRRPVERLALDLGFASANALRNMFKRYANLRPSDLRDTHGVEVFMDAFRRSIGRDAKPLTSRSVLVG